MDLRHSGAVREGLAVAGNAGFEGVDDHRVSDDDSDGLCMLAGGDYFPVFVALELGEGEAAGYLEGVLVLVLGARDCQAESGCERGYDTDRDQNALVLHSVAPYWITNIRTRMMHMVQASRNITEGCRDV